MSPRILECVLIASEAAGAGLPAPQVVLGRFATLFQTWLDDQQIENAVALVDWQELKNQFGDDGLQREQLIQWCRKFMTMWLSNDHGLMNRLGHCDLRATGYRDLPEGVDAPGPGGILPRLSINIPQMDSSSVWRVSKEDFGISGWATILRFSQSPNDAVVIAVDDVGSGLCGCFHWPSTEQASGRYPFSALTPKVTFVMRP